MIPGWSWMHFFQNADSIYCFLSAEEIVETNALIRSSIDDGSMQQHMEQAETQAEKIGEAVIVSARTLL